MKDSDQTEDLHPKHATAAEERAAEKDVKAAEDAKAALSGVPPARTADEQKHYDKLSPVDQQADDEKRRAAAHTKALATLPKRTKDEQKAYDAMSAAEKVADDDRRLAVAQRSAVETPEGAAARTSHEQAMKGTEGEHKP